MGPNNRGAEIHELSRAHLFRLKRRFAPTRRGIRERGTNCLPIGGIIDNAFRPPKNLSRDVRERRKQSINRWEYSKRKSDEKPGSERSAGGLELLERVRPATLYAIARSGGVRVTPGSGTQVVNTLAITT